MKKNDLNENQKPSKLKRFVKCIIFFIIIFILILLYSRFIGTKGLVVKEYKIVNSNFTQDFYGLKMVQISDIHYNMTTNKKDLEKIVNEVNLLKPDIVVFTGDLYSTNLTDEQRNELSSILKNINASTGKYAIAGNHDDEYFEDIIKKAGFTDLNNNYDFIYNSNYSSILIAGLNTNEDINEGMNKINEYLNQNNNLEENTEENNKQNIVYKILLLHEPDKILDINYSDYNLVLAGHSHNGQIRLPFIGALYTPKGSKKYYDEYYKLNTTDFYISSGIGTSITKLRLFNRPSINIYRLSSK